MSKFHDGQTKKVQQWIQDLANAHQDLQNKVDALIAENDDLDEQLMFAKRESEAVWQSKAVKDAIGVSKELAEAREQLAECHKTISAYAGNIDCLVAENNRLRDLVGKTTVFEQNQKEKPVCFMKCVPDETCRSCEVLNECAEMGSRPVKAAGVVVKEEKLCHCNECHSSRSVKELNKSVAELCTTWGG